MFFSLPQLISPTLKVLNLKRALNLVSSQGILGELPDTVFFGSIYDSNLMSCDLFF
jgi:hypothetical protein